MDDSRVTAWHPRVPGVTEVLHARFTDHAYPMHSHDSWTLLIVDSGTVRYELGRAAHATTTTSVTLLPPDVSHDGRAATEAGFRKRVVYLDREIIGADLLGSAVDSPAIADTVLHDRVARMHDALATRTDDLEAESRLAFVTERLRRHLRGSGSAPEGERGARVAVALRELLDERLVEGLSLEAAAGILHSHPTHLVRAFGAQFGVPPHLYVTGRRVELARRYLLDGMPAAEAATRAGFYDQSHLTRHFKRMHGVTPVAFAAGRAA
jgi:AraC-like DNA-binding protein